MSPLRRTTCLVATAITALACVASSLAAPAAWYFWHSKVGGYRACAQIAPGPSWLKDGGPYEGPQCKPKPRVFLIPVR